MASSASSSAQRQSSQRTAPSAGFCTTKPAGRKPATACSGHGHKIFCKSALLQNPQRRSPTANVSSRAGDPGTRAFASAGLNVWAWVFIATVPLAVFKTTDQPAVVSGNYTAGGFCFLLAVTAVLLAWLEKSKKGKAVDGENFTSVAEHFTSAGEESDEVSMGIAEDTGAKVVRIKSRELKSSE